MSLSIIYQSGNRLIGKDPSATDDNPVVNVVATGNFRRIGKPVRLLSYLARDPFAEKVEPYSVDVEFVDIETE